MKAIIYSFLTFGLILFCANSAQAQFYQTCSHSILPCGWAIPAPSNLLVPFSPECCSAPIFCDIIDLDGHADSTLIFDNVLMGINWCGTLENVQFAGFVANDTSLTLTITPSNCEADGIQTAIYTTNCDDEWVPLQCISPSAPIPMNMNVQLVPGDIYYLVIDGFAGDICDFEIEIIDSGRPLLPPEPITQIDGPTLFSGDSICRGNHVFSTPLIDRAFCYDWTLNPPIADMSHADSMASQSVLIDFVLPGTYQLCVEPRALCLDTTTTAYCEFIYVKPTIRTLDTLSPTCLGETMLVHGDSYGPGLYELNPVPAFDGCDSIYQIWVPFLVPSFSQEIIHPCDTCYQVDGELLCGPILLGDTLAFTNVAGCDSFALMVYDPLSTHTVTIGATSAQLDCTAPCIDLIATAQSSSMGGASLNTTLQWSTIDGVFEPSTDLTAPRITVCTEGTYSVISTVQTPSGSCGSVQSDFLVGSIIFGLGVPIEATICEGECFEFRDSVFCEPGSYVINRIGAVCDTSFTITVVAADLELDILDIQPEISGGQLGSVEFTILLGNMIDSIVLNDSLIVQDVLLINDLPAGDYDYVATDLNGCLTEGTFTIPLVLSSVEESSTFFVQLSPNPTNGTAGLSVNLAEAQALDVQVFDVAGRLIRDYAPFGKSQRHTLEIDLQNTPAGMYFVVLKTDNGVVVKKLIRG